MTEKITGAEALVRGLIAEGTDRIFGYPGGYIIPVFDRLYDYVTSRARCTRPKAMPARRTVQEW